MSTRPSRVGDERPRGKDPAFDYGVAEISSENPAGGLYSYRNDRGLSELWTMALVFRPSVFANHCGRLAFMNSSMRFARNRRSFR
jgi:hypothetical protein